MQHLYREFLGDKSLDYYLKRFEQFDQKAPGLNANWNWFAFIFGGFWALYRKMYGWFFAYWAIVSLLKLVELAGYIMLSSIVWILLAILFGIYANSLYYNKIKLKIAVAQLTMKDQLSLLEYLRKKGGVHTWVIWVFSALPVIGILSAILIPKLIDNPEYAKYVAAVPALILVSFVVILGSFASKLHKLKYGQPIFPKMEITNDSERFGFFIRLCLLLIYLVALSLGGFFIIETWISGELKSGIWDSVKLLMGALFLGYFAHLGLFNKKKLDCIFEKFQVLNDSW